MIRSLLCGVAIATVLSVSAIAGPYSSYSGVTSGAPDNPIPRAQLSIFESAVASYSPSPGVGPTFKNPSAGIAALGELYSPVVAPSGNNSPFNKLYRPQTGAEPNAFHDGNLTSPFGGDVNDPADTYGFIGIDAPGSITLSFGANRIFDGPGADFAVFENAFSFGGPTSLLAELAYVEVSSNGVDFARFPSISLNTAPTSVSGAFQGYDATNLYNLAGKHVSNWGTPFNLGELASDPLVGLGLLDLSKVRYVRLVDVVGSGALTDGSGNVIPGIARDSQGNPILDNWLTFDSAGFDYLGLPTGAVGVVHASVPEASTILLVAQGALGLAGTAWARIRRKRR